MALLQAKQRQKDALSALLTMVSKETDQFILGE
jgi:hypothetical protein